ncbi:thiopurine S-methyltransferase [Aquimarina sp. MAR_2010_214]|uniref:methyltransferase domain-containing protein n=1 Tax=Aquimarina sp. MAR_2010_214 TaxID=1250026 RepID=UPI000C7010F4|nr:methyltransferase domain-containing protein [Aquimarina sp. MAR_2010_214]PKV50070.1 thiopurine S-methyltransferase [Aquimarina sp. MAR_2010_214]
MIPDKQYWKYRYQNEQTGWDIGFASPPISCYFDQLTDKDIKILIPGCGNAYEAEYLFKLGFKNIYILDLVEDVLQSFKRRLPEFPSEKLICNDFFNYQNKFDLIIEQTFFCALHPERRRDYSSKISNLLSPKGKLVGVLFNQDFKHNGPPFGGNKKEYELLFSEYFTIKTLENCYNSIEPRIGNELFFIFENPL